jgi:hypothetical protein
MVDENKERDAADETKNALGTAPWELGQELGLVLAVVGEAFMCRGVRVAVAYASITRREYDRYTTGTCTRRT